MNKTKLRCALPLTVACAALLSVAGGCGEGDAANQKGYTKDAFEKTKPPPEYKGPGQPGGPQSGPASDPPAGTAGGATGG